ncbi:MAG: MFS transporter [Roseateles depolymerans]|uniref:MFS transporter n=1 Tax=Roseateles depolymerans TaxID=76731 RepID=A0A2W5DPQ6_9BURK|nr:MAG: MFS transporter [Roseateles depolymerans]
MSAARSASGVGAVVRVTSGNFIEMFDFFLFGFYATAIAKAFFPTTSEYASLMLTFATFGAGFLMRPLGAVVLGAYIDRMGRRKGLLLTLAIMASGTALVAFVPGYETLGLLAPALVLIGRLLQGLSAGVELGGVSVYLAEIAPPGRQGFYVSWQSGSQQLAIIVSALLGYGLNQWLDKPTIDAWGWRIPFFVGCLIIPGVFMIRRSLQETEAFLKSPHRPSFSEVLAGLVKHLGVVLSGTALIVMTTVSFYLITVYTPTFGKAVLKLSTSDALIVTLAVGVSNLFWLPVMGALSDRIGRAPIMIATTLVAVLTVYPAMSWLVQAPSFGRMLEVELWLSFLYGSYNGATVVALTELIPPHIRTAGFSFAYSLATALFGGFTPLASTWLIEVTGNRAAPGLWMTAAAALSLGAALWMYHGPGRRSAQTAAAVGQRA